MFEGLNYTAVSRERMRLRRRIEEEPALSKAEKGIEMTTDLKGSCENLEGHFY